MEGFWACIYLLASKCVHSFVRAVSQVSHQQTSTHKRARALSLSRARTRALVLHSLARESFAPLCPATVARVCVGVQRNASLFPPLDFAEHRYAPRIEGHTAHMLSNTQTGSISGHTNHTRLLLREAAGGLHAPHRFRCTCS